MTFLGSLGMIQIWHALRNCSFPRQKSTELFPSLELQCLEKKSKPMKFKPIQVQNSKGIICSQAKKQKPKYI